MASEASIKGYVAATAGHYTDAVRHYIEAINQQPNNPIVYGNRSRSYSKLQQFSKALEDAKVAVNIKPNDYIGYIRLGDAYSGLKQYDNAISAYKKGLQVDPNNVALKSNLSHVQARVKAEADLKDPTTRMEDLKLDNNDHLGNFNLLSAFDTKIEQFITQQNAIQQSILELLESLRAFNVNTQVDDGFSVKTALSVLNRMVDDGLIVKGCQLWCVATDLFEDAGKREMFIGMPDDDGRMAWLKHFAKKN